jgi:hypothetical protein
MKSIFILLTIFSSFGVLAEDGVVYEPVIIVESDPNFSLFENLNYAFPGVNNEIYLTNFKCHVYSGGEQTMNSYCSAMNELTGEEELLTVSKPGTGDEKNVIVGFMILVFDEYYSEIGEQLVYWEQNYSLEEEKSHVIIKNAPVTEPVIIVEEPVVIVEEPTEGIELRFAFHSIRCVDVDFDNQTAECFLDMPTMEELPTFFPGFEF